ncbi:MAG: hypothetical protein DMG17_30145 [Acidobacteria bacterium]|nr:MAG: hypothetical protein DMG17_30145 [Acidobacteriota bacterium]
MRKSTVRHNVESVEETAQCSHEIPKPAAILDEPGVHKVTSLSRSTRWRMERRGEFPKRVKLSIAPTRTSVSGV